MTVRQAFCLLWVTICVAIILILRLSLMMDLIKTEVNEIYKLWKYREMKQNIYWCYGAIALMVIEVLAITIPVFLK